MYTLIIIVHAITCLLLIILILIQRGKGGGLVESFSDFESMFGTKTNVFLTRVTTVLSVVFLCTCLLLAVISSRQSRSLLEGVTNQKVNAPQSAQQPAASTVNQGQPQAQTQAPAQNQPQEQNKAK